MVRLPDPVVETLGEALAELVGTTGLDVDQLFGERLRDPRVGLAAPQAHAFGLIEGIALAEGVTVIELLDAAGLL